MRSFLQEHFKECEKEAKLKPFAKAALAAKNERIDPVLAAKEEAQRWLRDSVSCLEEQVEGFEVSPDSSCSLGAQPLCTAEQVLSTLRAGGELAAESPLAAADNDWRRSKAFPVS